MSEHDQPGPSPGARRTAATVGLVLAMSFFGLSQTPAGLQYDFHGPWNRIPAAELQFWLGYCLLLLPGFILFGWSVWPDRWPTYERAWSWARSTSRPTFAKVAAGAAVAWLAVCLVGRYAILRGLSITDDENAVRFGGKVLATGRTWVDAPPLIESMPSAFLYLWEGRLASFDWLGPQVAWAITEVTGFEWPWPLLAALSLPAAAWVARTKVGEGYGLMVVGFLALSPMFLTLSFTTHAHLLSRSFIALFLAAWVASRDRNSIAWWIGTGSFVAAATLCRPFESAAILSPFALFTAWSLLRKKPWALKATIGMAIPLVVAAVAWLIHQHAITESWGVMARSASTPSELPWQIIPIPASASFTDPMRLWSRFGGNLAYNILMLVIFFGGPIGALLVALGARASAFSKLLAAGVAVVLLLALFHDDAGIHIVGPIHYSEVAPHLAILAAFGVRSILEWNRNKGIDLRPVATATITAFVLGSVFFSMWMMFGLRRQADVQVAIHEHVARANIPANSVLVAPEFHEVFKHHPDWNRTAAWVLRWPYTSPGASDRLIYIHDNVPIERVRTAYPERGIYKMDLIDDPPWVEISQSETP